ncbi:DUF3368 domain-containing protein [Haliscomenobacter hydrossis]|uniref:DUF3368 domain-containing protein n=1 Tax=Haliscomenobacter hydrossis (strain ATCC 27775 / DSM 1100 / LMG 10767 / O) TaxID=760192 RepID=F4KXH6_HALH1|nr:DUF3368 domain-containing protein [Haliscomenobacter hydrossis]AEE50347.1 hypothetical protein Halhy_2474 [Haliscomenobacter hydrossis DSM 1100]
MGLLRKIFSEINIPQAVYKELLLLKDYGIEVSIFSASWIKVSSPTDSSILNDLKDILDNGEAEAIALSLELKADLLIIDEKKGREVAKSFNLMFTGIGGVLIRAKALGVILEVKTYLQRIRTEGGFYLSEKALKTILQAAGEEL